MNAGQQSHAFAPGAIEHHRPTRSSARWLVRAGVFIAASACIGFVVGIFTGA